MKKILLNQGSVSLVDDEWFDELSKYTWYLKKVGKCEYARTSKKIEGKWKIVTMHRIISGASNGVCVDHIDNDGLNNQSKNLRLCNMAENNRNRSKRSHRKYKGVGYRIYKGKTYYTSCIKTSKTGTIYLGSFRSEELAARAYDKKAKEIFGDFANINFIENKK